MGNKYKKFIVNLLLILLFILLVAVLFSPLISDMIFAQANRLELSYRLQMAQGKYEKAVKTDPLNTKCIAEYGNVLMYLGVYKKDKASLLKQAEDIYSRALQLNPRCAEYAVKLGEIQIQNSQQSTVNSPQRKEYIDMAFENFIKALENDPNGFNTSCSIGYAGVNVFNELSKEQKALILNELKYALEIRPWYGRYIYLKLWKNTKNFEILQYITPTNLEGNKILYGFLKINNLWQFRKRQKKRVDYYMQKEKPDEFKKEKRKEIYHIEKIKQITTSKSHEKWEGSSTNGKHVIKNGQMYCNGTVYTLINVRTGNTKVLINAKKFLVINTKNTQDPKYSPYMIVRLDNKVIGETFVDNDEWKEYVFNVNTNSGIKVLSVEFVNDVYDPKRAEDRNLYIGSARIEID